MLNQRHEKSTKSQFWVRDKAANTGYYYPLSWALIFFHFPPIPLLPLISSLLSPVSPILALPSPPPVFLQSPPLPWAWGLGKHPVVGARIKTSACVRFQIYTALVFMVILVFVGAHTHTHTHLSTGSHCRSPDIRIRTRNERTLRLSHLPLFWESTSGAFVCIY